MKKKSVWALALAAMLMWWKPAVAAVNEAFDPVEYVNPLMVRNLLLSCLQEIPIRRSLVRGV